MNGYIPKPVNTQVLLETIESVMEAHSTCQDLPGARSRMETTGSRPP